MKLSKANQALLESYARTALSAGIAVWVSGNHDLKAMGVAALSAVAGPALRWLNKNDSAFGRGSK